MRVEVGIETKRSGIEIQINWKLWEDTVEAKNLNSWILEIEKSHLDQKLIIEKRQYQYQRWKYQTTKRY